MLVTCVDVDDGEAVGDDGDVGNAGDAGGDVDDCVLMTMAMMAMLFEHIPWSFDENLGSSPHLSRPLVSRPCSERLENPRFLLHRLRCCTSHCENLVWNRIGVKRLLFAEKKYLEFE